MTILPRPKGLPKKIPAWAWKWLKWRNKEGKHVPTPSPTPAPVPDPQPEEMYDDVTVSLIPVDAVAVAGYVDGRWPTYSQLAKKFPHAKHLVSIAVFSRDNADALDVEPGDAAPAEAAAWVKRQHSLGHKRPIVYTNASHGQALVNLLSQAGLKYGVDYLWWSAHYTYKPHLCSPRCGFGLKVIAHATQWTDKANGKSLDESLCSAAFFIR